MRPFEPTADSLTQHTPPEWWKDGKLGIFIHWGLYSVPAFAPIDHMFNADVPREIHVKYNPYAEWYMNTMRYEGSPTKQFHDNTYPGREYISFVKEFNQELPKWDPQMWSQTFKDVGAAYVVLTTKHHDGYTLWPSSINNPYRSPEQTVLARDIVGECK